MQGSAAAAAAAACMNRFVGMMSRNCLALFGIPIFVLFGTQNHKLIFISYPSYIWHGSCYEMSPRPCALSLQAIAIVWQTQVAV